MSFLFALLLSHSAQAAEFKMTFSEFAGDSTFVMQGKEPLVVQFYCPTYKTVLVYNAQGKKLFDFTASNCEEVKNYISLVLLSGGKVQATYDQSSSRFSSYATTGTDTSICLKK